MLHNTRKTILILTLITAVVLAGCGGAALTTESAPVPAPTEAATTAPVVENTAVTEAPTATTVAEAAPAGEISFSNDILPIFESRCVNCHGGQRTSEGLSLKTYDTLLAGSKNGAVLIAGDADHSLLVELSAQGKMPKRGPKLTPEQVQLLKDWINAGAKNN